jgi:hypothetical protein
MLVLLIERIYEYVLGIYSCGMIYVPSFTKVGKGVEIILGFVSGI